jgi:hypothetical protein
MNNENNNLKIISIKIIDIAYISCLYFFAGYYCAQILDKLIIKIFGKFDINKKYSKNKILFEIFFNVALSSIVSYICRNILQLIPFPLNGLYGFDHMKIKEVSNGVMISAFMIIFQNELQLKLSYLKNQ